MKALLHPFNLIGGWALGVFELIGGTGLLLLATARQLPRGLLHKRGRRLGWQILWFQMNRVGVRSIPIVSLVLFCIGAILAFPPGRLKAGLGHQTP